MTQRLSARDLARALVSARVELSSAESTLNALNVFPVPDGDTGTNMRASLEAGFVALSQTGSDDAPRGRTKAFVTGMTRAAQGNSGVILSEYVRGFVRVLLADPAVLEVGLDGPGLAEALGSASACARGAVGEPVEGTILSVAQAAALAARRCVDEAAGAGREADAAEVARAAHQAAQEALDATPAQLEALVRSRVVDAGGAGLLLVLDALDRVASGAGGLPRTNTRSWLDARRTTSLEEDAGCHVAAGGPAFEVVCVAEGLDDEGASALRDVLARWGDSVVVAGEERLHRVHLHTDEPLTAVSVMRERATISAVTMTHFDGPLPGCKPLLVAARDEAVRAYALALGAQTRDSREPGTPWGHAAGDVLADVDAGDGARSSNLLALLERLDDAASPFGDWEGEQAAVWEDDDPGDDVEFLRADSWRAARDLARLHLPGAESVLVCLAPGADESAAQKFLSLARTRVGDGGSIDVMRLDAGSLVLMEVTHG